MTIDACLPPSRHPFDMFARGLPHKRFNGRLRDECLQVSWFTSIQEARDQVEAWRVDYNKARPHSALGYLAPAQYLARLIEWTQSN
jgi:transposase InsO family protein